MFRTYGETSGTFAGEERVIMDTKKYSGPSRQWLEETAEIEATCQSFAAAGLAADLGMIDREEVRRYRAFAEARAAETQAPATER